MKAVTSSLFRPASALAVAALLAGLAPGRLSGQTTPPPTSPVTTEDIAGNARAALEKWVDTHRILSKEKRDWATGREVLEDRIALVKREIDTLRTKIQDADKTIADTEAKKDEVVRDNDKLKAASASLIESIDGFEKRTLGLLQRLPDPLREKLKPLSQRVPDDAAATKLSLGERFANVVGLLNEVTKANREISLMTEVRDIGSGRTAEVTVMYVGLAQAYYVTAKGDAAGIGAPSPTGFTWFSANDLAPRIAEAIAIFKNEKVAAFVQLPVQVK